MNTGGFNPLAELLHSHNAIERLIDLGKYDAAEKKIRELLAKDPNDVSALVWSARCAAEKGRIGAAIRALRSAARVDPENARVHAMLGIILCDDLDIKEGLKAWKRALEFSKGNAKMKALYAECLYRLDKLKAAKKFASEALAELPNNDDVKKTYSFIFEDQKSEQAIDSVLRENPEDDEALNTKGVYWLRKGYANKALDLFNAALRANPENTASKENRLLAAKCDVWFYRPFYLFTCLIHRWFSPTVILVGITFLVVFTLIFLTPIGLLLALFLMSFNFADFGAGLVAKRKLRRKNA